MLKLKKNKILNISLLLFWSFSWLSLNLNPIKIENYSIFNQLRMLMPFIIFLISFFFYIKLIPNKKKINDQFNRFIPFYIILLSYFIFSINNLNNYYNLYWILIMFFIVSIFYFTENNSQILNIFLIISSIFLILISAITLSKIIYILYTKINQDILINFYGYGDPTEVIFLSEQLPRATGIARINFFLFVMVSNLIFFLKSKRSQNFCLVFAIFFGFFSLIFQSRTVVGMYLIYLLLFCLIYFKKFFKYKFFFIIIFLTPILLSFLSQSYFSYKLSKKFQNNNISYFNKKNFDPYKNLLRKNKSNTLQTTRYQLWEDSIKIIQQNPFKGYGIQADRKLIGDSVHNSILYILICGGLLGFLGYLMLLYIIFLEIIKFIKFKKFNNYFHNVSITILLVILARSLLETSYAIMGIDFLMFILSYSIINYYNKNLSLKK